MPIRGRWRGLVVGLLGVSILAVQGCREEEQDQVLIHEKGVYQGPSDQPLGNATPADLRDRARIQSF